MEQPRQPEGEPTGPVDRPARSVPIAALAGAVVLIGLVSFALYRRHATTPAAPETPAAGEGSSGAEGEATAAGTTLSAKAPLRLTPEASILAERYRCVCGCNDTLSVCTCTNSSGSEEMKTYLQELVSQGKSPADVDAAMTEKFGPACLLSRPAPPQTLPSHAAPGKATPATDTAAGRN